MKFIKNELNNIYKNLIMDNNNNNNDNNNNNNNNIRISSF